MLAGICPEKETNKVKMMRSAAELEQAPFDLVHGKALYIPRLVGVLQESAGG